MTGFAEGFASGYGLVDATLHRRNMEDIEQQKLADEKQRRSEDLAFRDKQLQAQTEQHKAENQYRDKTLTENVRNNIATEEYNNKRLLQDEAQSKRSYGLDAARTQAAIATSNAERVYADEKRNRESAQLRAQNLFVTDPKTGVSQLNLTPGNELNDLKDIQTAYGVNVQKISQDLGKYQQQVQTIKNALVDPRHWVQNKAGVIQSLNDLEGHDINKGLGKYDGQDPRLKGGDVVKKEIDDIYPSPDGQGFVFSIKSTIKKGDQVFEDRGPMTQFRSSDPNDNQVRVVPAGEIIKRVEGYDAIGKVLSVNPQFVASINNLTARQAQERDKDKNIKDNYLPFESSTTDALGNVSKKTRYVDPKTSRVLDVDTLQNKQTLDQAISVQPQPKEQTIGLESTDGNLDKARAAVGVNPVNTPVKSETQRDTELTKSQDELQAKLKMQDALKHQREKAKKSPRHANDVTNIGL